MATNQWSEEDGGDDNFDIVKLDDLLPNQGNFHTYNHKVLYLKIKKNSQGGYSWEMGLNVFRLVTNQMYTLCLELIVGDVFLGQKAVITSTTAMSSGVFINGLKSQQYTYHYNDNGGQSRQSCYWRSLISLTKTGNNPHIVHIKVQMDQKGSDLSSYPSLYDRIYVIAYGISGFALDIDSNKVFDYHNAFNIEPTKVTYNVDIDMNNKKFLNVPFDYNTDNSVASVQMVKNVESMIYYDISRILYDRYFDDYYDLTKVEYFTFSTSSSGIVIDKFGSNLYYTTSRRLHLSDLINNLDLN